MRRSKTKALIVCLAIVGAMVSACAGPVPTPTPKSILTATPTAMPVTTLLPTPTIVTMATPSATPAITLTGTPAPTYTQKPTPTPRQKEEKAEVIKIALPKPRVKSDVSLEEALLKRRSVREYTNVPLTVEEISQLLWAAQGITVEWGGRTAPSAGALYPLELYLVVGGVRNLAPGVYRYKPEGHELVKIKDEDVRRKLAEAALDQTWVREGAIDIVIAAVFERTTKKYGDRGLRYVYMEAGHAAQNIYLQVSALDLGMVTVGAFYDDQVRQIVGMPENETPLYVIPVGRKS